MGSRHGVSRADIDVGLLHDRKMVALARRYRDDASTSMAIVLYLSAVLASWREDRAVSVEEAQPAWMLGGVDGYVAELRTVGLVDESGCVPQQTLDTWMAGLRSASERGRAAADARWHPPRRMRSHNGRNADAMPVPTVPTVPRSREQSTRIESDPRPLSEIIGPYADIVEKREEKS